MTTLNRLHEVLAGLLPVDHRFVLLKLPCTAAWLIPAHVVIDDASEYYEGAGWDEEIDEQPTGEELRGLVEANTCLESAAKEMQWICVKDSAKHIGGPMIEPPDDQLWAVEENGGCVLEVTDIAPQD